MNHIIRLPTLFMPQGGGPCFFMGPPAGSPRMWDELAAYGRGIDASLEADVPIMQRSLHGGLDGEDMFLGRGAETAAFDAWLVEAGQVRIPVRSI